MVKNIAKCFCSIPGQIPSAITCIIFLILFSSISTAKPPTRDSLLQVWNNTDLPSENRLEVMGTFIRYYHSKKHPDSVIYYGKMFEELASEVNNLDYLAYSKIILGNNAIYMGLFEEAASELQISLKLYKQIGQIKNLPNTHNSLATAYKYLGKIDSALFHYQKALDMFEQTGNSARTAGILSNMSTIFKNQGDLLKALTYTEKALDICLNFEGCAHEAPIRTNLANLYKYFDDDQAALNEYVKALEISQEKGNPRGIVRCLNNMHTLYIKMGESGKAKEHLEEALAVSLKEELFADQVMSYNSLGDLYFLQNKFSVALDNYQSSLSIAEEKKISYLIPKAKLDIGRTLIEMENLKEAEQYLRTAIPDENNPTDIMDWFQGKRKMTQLFILQENWKQARSYGQEGYNRAREISNLNYQASFAQDLVTIYKHFGNTELALKMYEIHISLRDSLDARDNLGDLLKQEYRINFEKQALQDSLENAAILAVQVAENKRRRSISFALLIGLIIAIILGFLLWKRYQQTQKQKEIIEEDKAKLNQVNSELNDANQKLQELDNFKSQFFTNISHEFRTPLTVIQGMIDQVHKKPEKWLDKGSSIIERNTSGLLQMVNQILDLRKLESGNLTVSYIQDDLIPFTRLGSASFESMAENKGIDLDFSSSEESIMMDFDPEKLAQVQTNLLSNAIKFTPKGGKITLKVFKESEKRLKIEVSDTGCGIPAEKLPLIFDRFYQVDGTDKRVSEGTGIGLSLSKELIQLMEGELSVKSEVDKGSVFTITLPITQAALVQPAVSVNFAKTSDSQPTILSPSKKKQEHPNLLIIEDNPDIVSYLYACLEDQYNLSSAPNGQAGIEAAFDQVPDLIITDVMMPLKNGYEVCETLKLDERTSHIPIVMLTAKADQASRLEGYKRGADAYLAKPFDQEELFIRLAKLLEIRLTLQRRYKDGNIPSDPQANDPVIQTEDAFLVKVRKCIMDNLDDSNYRGELLGKDLGMSRSNLHRKIKALTNLSPSHFIRVIRIDHARELMNNPELNISEIAYRTGFSHPRYFNKVFREILGTSPTDWREKELGIS